MEIETRFSRTGFLELKVDQQEINVHTIQEAQDVIYKLTDVIEDLQTFIEDNPNKK